MSTSASGSKLRSIVVTVAMFVAAGTVAAEPEFEPLFDGKTLAGWKAQDKATGWRVQDGAIVCGGPWSLLFYIGPDAARPADFRNFHFKTEVMTRPNSNSGIFFHVAFRPKGGVEQGYEIQVNNSFERDPVRTGSIYHVVKNFTAVAKDDTWYTQEVVVKGKQIVVIVDGRVLFEFVEPEGVTGPRRLAHGTFALQSHDPGSEVHFRNIRVRELP